MNGARCRCSAKVVALASSRATAPARVSSPRALKSLPVATRGLVEALFAAHLVDPPLHRALHEQVPRVGRLGRLLDDQCYIRDLVRAGLEARLLDARTGRHNLDGEMIEALRAGRLGGAALLLAAMALSGCGTIMNGGAGTSQTSESEDNQFAASPANISSLSAVIQRNPSDPQAYNMRGSVFGQSGRNDEALADFNKAISLDPNYAQAYANRGLIYRKTGKLEQALADYNKALALDQNYPVAYLGRGVVYRLKKQPFDAFKDFNQAISIRPDNADAYYNRGLLYQSQRQHQFAIDDFTTAIGLSQNQAEPYIARGLSYMAVNDLKAAAGDLDEAVGDDPQSLQAWTTRAFVYERMGDKEKAAGSYARALNIKSDHEPAKQGFARVGGKMGQTYQTF